MVLMCEPERAGLPIRAQFADEKPKVQKYSFADYTKTNGSVNNNVTSATESTIMTPAPKAPPKAPPRAAPRNQCPILAPSKFQELRSVFNSYSPIDLESFQELGVAIVVGLWHIFVAVVLTFIPRRFRYKDVGGQVILITGAGSGIGKMMAKKFALEHGAIIVAWDINKQGNDETVQEIRTGGGKCHGYVVDVSSREAIYEAAEVVKREVGRVDILINNAGIVSGKKFVEVSDAQIEKTFQVNALANFWTVKAFLPDMLDAKHGQVVTIASLAGLFGTNRLVDYCASKFAAVGFDEALRNELQSEGHTGISTTLVCPYYINTGMFDGINSKIIPLLKPEPVVDDIVAGVLTNQEFIVIPRYLYIMILLKSIVPGDVGRTVAAALGITGTMFSFKGRQAQHGEAETAKTK